MDELGAEKPMSCMTVRGGRDYLQRIMDGDEHGPDRADEPIFILRGQDLLAPAVVFAWAHSAERHGVGLKKLAGAWDAAGKMLGWGKRRIPD